MSEKSRQFEAERPEPKLRQVVLIPYSNGLRRCIVVEILHETPDFVMTSEILHENTEEERLAFPGTSSTETMQPTNEIWDRERVINGLLATYPVEGARKIIEPMFPDTE